MRKTKRYVFSSLFLWLFRGTSSTGLWHPCFHSQFIGTAWNYARKRMTKTQYLGCTSCMIGLFSLWWTSFQNSWRKLRSVFVWFPFSFCVSFKLTTPANCGFVTRNDSIWPYRWKIHSHTHTHSPLLATHAHTTGSKNFKNLLMPKFQLISNVESAHDLRLETSSSSHRCLWVPSFTSIISWYVSCKCSNHACGPLSSLTIAPLRLEWLWELIWTGLRK